MASSASLPARGPKPKPPDRGSFLLDHFRECSATKELYLACLKKNNQSATADVCRTLTAEYLQCRMEASLMREEPLSSLGLQDDLQKKT